MSMAQEMLPQEDVIAQDDAETAIPETAGNSRLQREVAAGV